MADEKNEQIGVTGQNNTEVHSLASEDYNKTDAPKVEGKKAEEKPNRPDTIMDKCASWLTSSILNSCVRTNPKLSQDITNLVRTAVEIGKLDEFRTNLKVGNNVWNVSEYEFHHLISPFVMPKAVKVKDDMYAKDLLNRSNLSMTKGKILTPAEVCEANISVAKALRRPLKTVACGTQTILLSDAVDTALVGERVSAKTVGKFIPLTCQLMDSEYYFVAVDQAIKYFVATHCQTSETSESKS